MGRILVIGVGPGDEGFLTPAAAEAIERSELLVGGRRILEGFKGRKKEVGRDLGEVMDFIRRNMGKRVGVLTSGDPCFYSLLGRILEEFPKEEVEIIPGISSLQLCLARVKETLNDATLVSLHGRGLEGLSAAAHSRKLVLLTDSKTPASAAAAHLLKLVPRDTRAFVCENLSREGEQITEGSLEDIAKGRFSGNAVMVVTREGGRRTKGPGIPDGLLEKGNTPMTKEEVRAVTLAKAGLREGSVVYDIGAGTGSISIEAALRAKRGMVYAVEREEERIELIKRNLSKFGLENVKPVLGEAPEALEGLPDADRVIIGGSGGRLGEILRRCDAKLTDGGRMVLNIITLESLSTALAALAELGYESEVVQLIVNQGRRLGGRLTLTPKTAVFVISAWRKAK